MIYTLTTNPAIDMNFRTEGIDSGLVNRTSNTIYSPNGKGINVTFILKHFNVDSKVLGFFGGFTGKYIVDELKNRKFEVYPIWVEDTTRINIFINDGKNEFKFVNPGSLVPETEQEELLNKLKELDDCTHLVISGSLPRGINSSYYEKILDVCKSKKIEVILDISSPKLKDLLQYEPLLIKPNDEEIKSIFDIEIKNECDVISVLHILHDFGAKSVLLTLGEKGSYFSNRNEIYYCSAQKINLVSSACAGDSALGAFLSEWLDNGSIETALKKSAATGANVAESDGLGDLKNVSKYFNNIKVRRVVF